MKSVLPALLLGALTACFASCATPGGGGGTRALNHTYQDSRGLTVISLFDMGTEARGSAQTIGNGSPTRTLVLTRGEFEQLWGRLDESKLASFAARDRDAGFDARNNYVIAKGTMPGGTTTYVIPKSRASAAVQAWVKSFRAKTGS